MNKYLKLFETEDAFKSCLEAKIGGDNTVMGFPNVSVIGAEDSNGNFSASKIHYIKDLTKAQDIHEVLLANSSHWVNPTTVNIVSDKHTVKTLHGNIESGPGIYTMRFQPYDWYDKDTKTTYYAFISNEAFANILTNHAGNNNVNLLDGKTIGMNLLTGFNGYDPNYLFSNLSKYDSEPNFSGRILYVKDLSKVNEDEIYQRKFSLDNGVLTFDDIEPFPYTASQMYLFFGTSDYDGAIEGYPDAESGSGSGNGN